MEAEDGRKLDLREVGVLDVALLALGESVERPDGVLPLLSISACMSIHVIESSKDSQQ